MRCLLVIALCFVVANAQQCQTKRCFLRLLNRNQNRYALNDDLFGRNRYTDNLLGSDDVDDYIDDYVDEIRRERMFERDESPRFEGQWNTERDFEDQWNTQVDEYDNMDMEEIMPTRRYLSDEDTMMRTDRYMSDEDTEMRSPMLKEVEDANCKLATRLYKQCKDEKDDKNTVVSPLSVQLALAALNIGARGNTKRQIGRVIGGRLQKQERKRVFKTLIRQLKFRNTGYSTGSHMTKINPVTGIFVAQTTRAQQMFIQQVKGTLGATVKHCSFSHQPQQCRQVINQWVAQKTQHKINHIVPQDAITDNTKMVLVNALEMKATWGPQMRRHVTKEAKFYPLDTKKVKIVEVMETEGRFKYYEDELVKIVGVPTKERELTLYAIVPKDKDGLNEVEKLHLQDSIQLKELLTKTDMHTRHVGVQLPKFQIKHKIDVRRTLRKQGVTDAFDPLRADFTGITGVNQYEQEDMYDTYGYNPMHTLRRNPFLDTDMDMGYGMDNEFMGRRETKLHLNKFIHQCTIKITENGITASTGSQMEEMEEYGRMGMGTRYGRMGRETDELNMFDEMTGLYRREPTGEKMVKANRAFAFVLKHNPTNQLIMVGRVIDAAQKKVNDVRQTIDVVDQL